MRFFMYCVSRAVSFPKTGKIASVEGIKIMGASLIEHLRQVEDFRTTDGRRHRLWLVLLFVIMGTMSGYVGYRGWGDFVKRHRRILIEMFGIQNHRHIVKDLPLGERPVFLEINRR
ncbi:transposase family protein [Tolypothrix sp. PCC 7910]|uniref:transposase family protein n=1 Tax=Tolypothrix sp. PCC 7910 TaxID=2099387 RepID=UPI00352FF01C